MPDVNPYASSVDVGPGATRVRWQVFTLCCATSWTLYLHRYTFALTKESLASEWGVDLVSLGAMDSVFYASYLIFQVPSGLAAEFFGTRMFLGWIIIAWSACLALHALVPGRNTMYGVRVLFGMTQAGTYPTLSKASKAWFPVSIRTSLQGWIASFFGRAGGASANLIFATIMLGVIGMPWRMGIAVLAVGGAALGVVVLRLLRDTPGADPRVNAAERRLIGGESIETAQPTGYEVSPSPNPIPPSARDGDAASALPSRLRPRTKDFLWRLNRRSVRNMVYFLTQGLAATFADAVYVAWLPYFLTAERGMDASWMGVFSSFPLWGGACGGVVGGYSNDWLLRSLPSRRWARSIVGSAGMGMACLLMFSALAAYDNPYLFCLVLTLSKFFGDWSQPTVWGTVTDIAGRHTATVFSLVNGVGGVGALVAPTMMGAIAQYISWNAVFVAVGASYALGAAMWLAVNCTVPLAAER